jgi:hypothetical protein
LILDVGPSKPDIFGIIGLLFGFRGPPASRFVPKATVSSIALDITACQRILGIITIVTDSGAVRTRR